MKRTAPLVSLFCLAVWLAAVGHVSGQADNLTAKATDGRPQQRTPAIDGDLQPELIADDRALSMFLLMAAQPVPTIGTLYLSHTLNAGIDSEAQLDESEIEAVRLVAAEFAGRLTTLYQSRPVTARDQVAQAFRSARDALLQPSTSKTARSITNAINTRIKPTVRVFIERPSLGAPNGGACAEWADYLALWDDAEAANDTLSLYTGGVAHSGGELCALNVRTYLVAPNATETASPHVHGIGYAAAVATTVLSASPTEGKYNARIETNSVGSRERR